MASSGLRFRHVLLIRPVGHAELHGARRPRRRIGALAEPLRVVMPPERIDHRPEHRNTTHARIDIRRARRQRDRGVARIVRPHGGQHRQMAAARRAGNADEVRTALEPRGVRLHPADRIIDVHRRIRIAARPLPEVERRDGDAVIRKGFVMGLAAGAVVFGPHPAVQLDHHRERSRALRPVAADEQRLVAVAKIFDVLDLECTRPCLNGFHRHERLPPKDIFSHDE